MGNGSLEGDGAGQADKPGQVTTGEFGLRRVTARVSAVDPSNPGALAALARLALTAPEEELAHGAAMALARMVLDLANDEGA